MKIVYEYPLHLMEQQVLQLPGYAQILDIQKQDDQYRLWALVDTDTPLKDYVVTMVGTGQPIPDFVDLRGAVFNRSTPDGWAVWHWFVQPGKVQGT